MAEGGLLDEIFVALGFKVDDKKVKDFDNSLKTTVGSLKRVVTVAAGAVIALDRMTNALLRANQAYMSFNQQTNISLASMNRLIGAGMLANYNLTPEAMMSSIQSLQSNLAAIRIGQGNIAPFQMLGINVIGKDAVQIFEELREALQGVDSAMATNIIQQMGLSPEMLSLLRLTREEFAESSAEAAQFQLEPEQRKQLDQFARQMRSVHMEMGYLKDKVLISIAPYLIRFLNGVTKILEVLYEYRGLLLFLGAGGVAAVMRMNGAIKILGVTINAAFGKWLIALTAIYAILEDLAVWKMGGQSLIGDLYEWGQRGFNKDPNAKSRDQMYEELYGKKRGFWQKYADWGAQGGIWGTLFGGFTKRNQHEYMQKILQDKDKLWWKPSNLSSNVDLQQTNYITLNDGGGAAVAQTTADLAFAYLQLDRSV